MSSGGSRPDAANASCPATPGVTANGIRLGLLYPNTGITASLFSPYRAGVDARLGVADAAGGVNGRQVTYDWDDDGSTLAGNLAAARQLIQGNQDFSLLESSTVATGSAAWLHQQGIPVVGPSIEVVWTEFNNMFSYTNFITAGPAAASWGRYVKEHGGTRAAIIYSGFNDTSKRFHEKFVASLKAAGVSVIDNIDAEPSAYNADAIVAQLKDDRINALVGATDPTMFVTVAATAQASGAGLKTILSSTGYDPQVLARAGNILKGSFSVFVDDTPFEQNLPAHQRYLAAMAKYSPQVQPPQSEFALEGWVTTDLLLTGLKAAGPCPTRAGFITALRAVKGFTAGGLLPKPVNIGANFGKPNSCYTYVELNAAGTGWDVTSSVPRCDGLVDQ